VNEATRIRAQLAGDKATVRVLMNHDMESGQRKDSSGKLIPAWHIQEVTVALNGKTVLTVHLGPSMSKNPYLQFVLRGAKPGDRLTLAWVDNRGQRRSDDALVT